MPEYMVEQYLPDLSRDGAGRIALSVAVALDRSAARNPVRLVTTLALIDDDMMMYVVEAGSPCEVRTALVGAGIDIDRVVDCDVLHLRGLGPAG